MARIVELNIKRERETFIRLCVTVAWQKILLTKSFERKREGTQLLDTFCQRKKLANLNAKITDQQMLLKAAHRLQIMTKK
jgi:hypothetical protein